MIDDWVLMITHDSQRDQISLRDANQNFRKSCNISDDKNFRTFVRSIRVVPLDDKQKKLNKLNPFSHDLTSGTTIKNYDKES